MKLTPFIAVFTLALSGLSVSALDVADLDQKLQNSPGRPEADKARDSGRKPAEVLNFFGIEEGMTAIDLVAADGYYTEVLSIAVGSTGEVYMQNSPAALTGERGTRTEQAISDRLAQDRLANVTRIDRDVSDLGLAENSIDAAVIALEFHELYRSPIADAAMQFLNAVKYVLKPGGVLGIIEHSGNSATDPTNDVGALHRAVEEQVVEHAREAGFLVAGTTNILRNPADDRTKGVFDPSVRGVTDRFVLRLEKPAQ